MWDRESSYDKDKPNKPWKKIDKNLKMQLVCLVPITYTSETNTQVRQTHL